MYVLRNLLEVHMYLNEYNKVKSSTVMAGMTWAWPIWLRFIQLWRINRIFSDISSKPGKTTSNVLRRYQYGGQLLWKSDTCNMKYLIEISKCFICLHWIGHLTFPNNELNTMSAILFIFRTSCPRNTFEVYFGVLLMKNLHRGQSNQWD